MSEHPPIDTLARFARGVLPPRELATVAIHVARCETCRTAATRPSLHPGAAPNAYGEAIHRVAGWARTRATRHERDKRRAPGALDQIVALPTEDWNRAIRSSPRYQSFAFAQHALKTCKAGWSDNPHRSERLAQLALEVVNRLPSKEHGRRNLNDLRAKAWGFIANCKRIRNDYWAIPDALATASACLRHGNQNDRSRADLLSFTTSFLLDIRRLHTSLEVCAEIGEISAQLNDKVTQFKNVLHLARLDSLEKRPGAAIGRIEEASELVQATATGRLSFLRRLNLAHYRLRVGSAQRGLSTLRSIGPTQLAAASVTDRWRLAWTLARLRWTLGDVKPALALLADCRERFYGAEIPVDGALVDLELATMYLSLGHAERARVVLSDALPIFVFNALEEETLLALDLFSQAEKIGGR